MKHRVLVVALASLLLASGCAGYRANLAARAEREGDMVRSFNIWRSLARQGNAEAQYYVGRQYLIGMGVQRSDERAVPWFRKAAAKGHIEARDKLAQLYINGRGNPETDPDAERWLRESIESALAESRYKLALMYIDGVVVEQDAQEGLRWLRMAADNWGGRSHGIDDQLNADGRLRMAAELGLADAQLGLGKRYIVGSEVPLNRAEAAKWYYYAAEQGHARAQLTLGWAYGKGEGVTKDYQEASRWFLKAAEQGLAEAEYQIGAAYRRGLGLPQDNVLAYTWFNLAAGHGLRKARTKRRETSADMSEVDIARAENMALERWLAAQED